MCLHESIGKFSSRIERIPLKEWSQSTINVLLQGDYMYIKALNNGLFGINPGLELTSIDNLPRFIEVSCNMNMLSFKFIDATVNNINYNKQPVLHHLHAESSTTHLISFEYMPFFKFFLFHILY